MLTVTTRSDLDEIVLDRFRKAAAFRLQFPDKPKKLCFYCQKSKYPVESFYPHKMLGAADYCPDCKLLTELEDQVFSDYWISEAKTPYVA